jgi:glycogenin
VIPVIPVIPVVSVTPASLDTEVEIFQPTTEEPMHETAEIPKEVEEAYVPPVVTPVDKGKQPEIYSSWDASK